MELKTSDLFEKKGKNFDWAARIADQEKLIERINEMNQDIVHPKYLEISKIRDDIKEFVGEGIASIVYLEYALDKLTDHGVVIT
jgi:hypothetical protein